MTIDEDDRDALHQRLEFRDWESPFPSSLLGDSDRWFEMISSHRHDGGSNV